MTPHPLAPSPTRTHAHPGEGEPTAGFSLVELLISLALLLLAVAFAAQLLMETAQQLADVAAEQIEAPIPLVRARLRADIQASQQALCILDPEDNRTLVETWLLRHPAGTIIYRVDDGVLSRRVVDDRDKIVAEGPVLGGVEGWECEEGGGLLWFQLEFRRRAVRRRMHLVDSSTGLPPPFTELRRESLLVATRGAGLGAGW